jgi:hypothetical protein
MFLKRTLWFLGIALWLVEPFSGGLLGASPDHGKHCTMKTACKGTCCCKAYAVPATAPCDEAPGLYASSCGHPSDQGLTFPSHFGKALLTGTIRLGISGWFPIASTAPGPILQTTLESPTPPPEVLPS